jgi:ribosome-binding factor A
MPQRNSRQQRIESQMQRTLAQLVAREVKDPRVGHATITAVSLVPDMSAARVWFLPFGLGAPADEALAGLRSAAGFLRGEVARQLGLRHAPRLEFLVDTQLERAQSLTELIDKAVASDRKPTAAGEPGAAVEPEA